MVSTFTSNIQWEEPARGDQVGTWDTPVNNNGTLIDRVVGAITTIGLNNSNVVLSSPQYQSKSIIFNSTLTGSVSITFATSFIKSYEIANLCTGTSAFTITLQTTVSGGQVVACKPGEFFDIVNDGTNIKFKNLGHVGTYWDYCGSSVPNWVSGCTVPPYLNCDGTTYNSSVYPALFTVLGSTVLPDSKGRARYVLNQASGRLTSGGAGIDGNTLKAAGGANGVTLVAANIPSITSQNAAQLIVVTGFNNINYLTKNGAGSAVGFGGGADNYNIATNTGVSQSNNNISVAYTNAATTFANAAPGYVGGLTLIRSA